MSEKLFNVGIKAVICNGDKVLILKAPRDHDTWEFPGGRMDGDETIGQTLKRELQEELPNIQNIKIKNLLDATRIHRDIKENVSLVLLFYKVEAEFRGEVEISHEHTSFRWATGGEINNLRDEKMAELANKALNVER